MVNCEYTQNNLLLFIEGNLSDVQKEIVNKHLETCQYCQKELEQLKELNQIIGNSPQFDVPEGVSKGFYQILREEKQISKNQKTIPLFSNITSNQLIHYINRYKAAAAVIIFVFGFVAGTGLINKSDNSDELSQLRHEIKETKNLVILSMLKQQSASERIKAVNYSYQYHDADKDIINALVATLESDENVNVRLAAAQALFRFANKQGVTETFLKTLRKQSDPIIQIAIIDMLVLLKEEKAVKDLMWLLNKEDLQQTVRLKAEHGLKQLL